jgi:L-threonylcarbamoyladenylate synthase
MVSSWRVRLAARIIQRGGIVAYPTEGVFGLGCDPRQVTAVERLLRLKGRSWRKGLILIAADFSQLRTYVLPLPAELQVRAEATWPGAVTWLLPARPGVSCWLRGKHPTLAVRVTAHPLAAALCQAVGHPIVSTSANRANRSPARTTFQAHRAVGASVDYLLPGETSGRAGPSEIRDGLTGQRLR